MTIERKIELEVERAKQNLLKSEIYFSRQELADRLGVTSVTVWRWEKQGVIPKPQLPNKWSLRQVAQIEGKKV